MSRPTPAHGSSARPPAPSPLSPGIEQIDAHLHLWDLSVCTYPWLGPQHGALYRNFTPQEAHAELAGCGVTQAVVVQAEDSLAETDYLLGIAREHPWVAGVVGWLPLSQPSAALRTLERLAAEPHFRGMRHLVHDDPRPDFLELSAVRESLRGLATAGLPFDVPDAWPRHLTQTRRLAEDLPELTVVVDHLAKPPIDGPDLDAWHAELRRVAELPNTVAKFSGLRVPGLPFTPEAVRPVWEIALEHFGSRRLMFGGDWPMTVPAGGYRRTYDVMVSLVAELSAAEQAEIMAGTARRVYRLPTGKGPG